VVRAGKPSVEKRERGTDGKEPRESGRNRKDLEERFEFAFRLSPTALKIENGLREFRGQIDPRG